MFTQPAQLRRDAELCCLMLASRMQAERHSAPTVSGAGARCLGPSGVFTCGVARPNLGVGRHSGARRNYVRSTQRCVHRGGGFVLQVVADLRVDVRSDRVGRVT